LLVPGNKRKVSLENQKLKRNINKMEATDIKHKRNNQNNSTEMWIGNKLIGIMAKMPDGKYGVSFKTRRGTEFQCDNFGTEMDVDMYVLECWQLY